MNIKKFLQKIFIRQSVVGAMPTIEIGPAPQWDKIPVCLDYLEDSDEFDFKQNFIYLNQILDQCFRVTLNMNDIFGWACADCEQVDADDMVRMLPLMHDYGTDILIAYVAVKRGHGVKAAEEPQEPVMKYLTQERWIKMVDAIVDLASNGTIMCEEYWERERQAAKTLDESDKKK